MTRFLIIYEQIDNTVEVNLSAIKNSLDNSGVVAKYRLSKKVSELDLNWCDVCYSIRPSSLYTLNIAKTLKASGRFFITMFDDDLLNISKSSSMYWRIDYMKSCIALSDALVASNPLLFESYKKIAPEIKYILSRAYVLESEIQPVQEVGEIIKISYVAGRDHTELFETYISPIIDRVLVKFPKVELHLMGIEPDLMRIKNRSKIVTHPVRSYEDYKVFMRSNHFDIGLAPLNDDDFSNKKYFRKYIDYAEFGILGLYSNCMPYTLVVKNGYNGILVENKSVEWEKALTYSIDNISSMKELVKNSQKHLRTDFSLESVNKHFWEELNPVICKSHNKVEVHYNISLIEKMLFDNRARYHRLASHYKTDGFIKTTMKLLKRLC